MKLLLEESAPRRLAASLPQTIQVRTVQQMGRAGSTNGELLRLAAADRFDVLLAVDRGFEHEQSPDNPPVPAIIAIAARSRLPELRQPRPLVPDIVAVLSGNLERRVYRVQA